jgi:hypothetical protein
MTDFKTHLSPLQASVMHDILDSENGEFKSLARGITMTNIPKTGDHSIDWTVADGYEEIDPNHIMELARLAERLEIGY